MRRCTTGRAAQLPPSSPAPPKMKGSRTSRKGQRCTQCKRRSFARRPAAKAWRGKRSAPPLRTGGRSRRPHGGRFKHLTWCRPRPVVTPRFKEVKLKVKFFMELCGGKRGALSQRCRGKGYATIMPADSHKDWGGMAHDLMDPGVQDFLMRLACSGVVSWGHSGPPCGPYSWLRTLPGGAAVRDAAHIAQGFLTGNPKQEGEFQYSQNLHRFVLL